MHSDDGVAVAAQMEGWGTRDLAEPDWPAVTDLAERAYADVHPYTAGEVMAGLVEMGPDQMGLVVEGPRRSPIGFVAACPRPLEGDDPADTWQIWYLAVDAEFRRRGVGAALLKALIDRLDGHASSVWVWTWPHARPAINAYKRAGMRIQYPPGAYIYFEPTTVVLRRRW